MLVPPNPITNQLLLLIAVLLPFAMSSHLAHNPTNGAVALAKEALGYGTYKISLNPSMGEEVTEVFGLRFDDGTADDKK